jgi:hypothetical protein
MGMHYLVFICRAISSFAIPGTYKGLSDISVRGSKSFGLGPFSAHSDFTIF